MTPFLSNHSTSTLISSQLQLLGTFSGGRVLKAALISSVTCLSKSASSVEECACTACLIGYREDVITLQNPHGLPSPSVSATKVQETQKGKVIVPDKPAVAGPVSSTQKATVPCSLCPPFPLREVISMA